MSDPDELPTTGYLPMDCPVCGRRRLLPTIVTKDGASWVAAVACEGCETAWPDDVGVTG